MNPDEYARPLGSIFQLKKRRKREREGGREEVGLGITNRRGCTREGCTHSWHRNVKFLFTGEWPSDLHALDTGQHAYFGFESIRTSQSPNGQCEIREQMQIVALESSSSFRGRKYRFFDARRILEKFLFLITFNLKQRTLFVRNHLPVAANNAGKPVFTIFQF